QSQRNQCTAMLTIPTTSALSLRITTKTTSVFFFQAEDGIRDATVTGVQTCALPIYRLRLYPHRLPSEGNVQSGSSPERDATIWRSEERRVGKECRSGWGRYDEKQNRDR